MFDISIASSPDRQEILAFLDREDLAMNVWLTQAVCGALDWPTDHDRVLVCRTSTEISGVAAISGSPDTGFNESYCVRMDASDRGAITALIDALPNNATAHFQLLHPVLQQYLSGLQGSHCALANPYFTVSQEEFRPVSSDRVVESYTAEDAHLFEGCECERNWEHRGAEHRILGITRDGKAATSVNCSPVTPIMPSGRRVVAISGLHTETKYRRKGLARLLVSHATELILGEGDIPCYWTEPDNEASQALCMSLGYYQYAREMRCAWRKGPVR